MTAPMAATIEDPRTAVAVARITRRCPGCGAAIEHGEEDGAVGCDFCGAHLAIGAGAANPAYAMAAAGDRAVQGGGAPEQWIAEAKRALRAAGLRVRALEPPRAFLVPFHRLRAHAWQWYRSMPRPEREETGQPLLPPSEVEGHFRLGIWDATIDAVPSLGLGPGNLGFRTQVLAWTPLADFLDPEGTPRPDYAVLPVEVGAVDARGLLARRLSANWQLPPQEASDQWILVTDAAPQLMYAPLLLCPFLGPQGRAAIILDGITFRAGRVLAGDELTRLETRETAARARPPDALPAAPPLGGVPPLEAGTLIPLSCPECSSPLSFLRRARVHRCTICGRHWTVHGQALAPVPCVALIGSTARRPATQAVFLPFYRLRGGGGDWFVPAARGRNPRAVWNFALGLARRPRVWDEADLAIDAAASAAVNGRLVAAGHGAAVEMTPATAGALAPFTARCLEQAIPAAVETDLAWIAFEPHGPDLVEPGSGLGLPRCALTPWETPGRLKAPADGAASAG